jgi:hypothetical protein
MPAQLPPMCWRAGQPPRKHNSTWWASWAPQRTAAHQLALVVVTDVATFPVTTLLPPAMASQCSPRLHASCCTSRLHSRACSFEAASMRRQPPTGEQLGYSLAALHGVAGRVVLVLPAGMVAGAAFRLHQAASLGCALGRVVAQRAAHGLMLTWVLPAAAAAGGGGGGKEIGACSSIALLLTQNPAACAPCSVKGLQSSPEPGHGRSSGCATLGAARVPHLLPMAHSGLTVHSLVDRPAQGLTDSLSRQLPCTKAVLESEPQESKRQLLSAMQPHMVACLAQGSVARKQLLCTAHFLPSFSARETRWAGGGQAL